MGIDPDHAKAGGVPREDGGWEWRDVQGQLHREDGPAVIWPDGQESWYLHDQLHRDDGPAVVRSNGDQAWYLHDQLHREDGPAVIWPNGGQEWYVHDQLHRVDGPAVTWSDGTHAWWVHGQDIAAEVAAWMSEQGITWPFTPEQQAEFALRWG